MKEYTYEYRSCNPWTPKVWVIKNPLNKIIAEVVGNLTAVKIVKALNHKCKPKILTLDNAIRVIIIV